MIHILKLYEYQLDSIKRLKTGSILCGGVGSGKSRTALAYFLIEECKGRIPLTQDLPNSEYEKIIFDKFKAAKEPKDLYIITTAKKRDDYEWEQECAPFVFQKHKINVKVDSWNNVAKYIDVKDAFFIFDEQRVIGSGTWVKSFLKITKKNNWILLSATPGDTWMDYIPVFIANGFYKNRTEFLRTHVVYCRYVKFPKVDKYLGTGRLLKYRNAILVDMDYKRKTVHHNITIFADYDKRLFMDIVRLRWDPFKGEPIKSIADYCYILRRVVNSSDDRQEKIKQLIKENDRAIIFYNFNYELEILRFIARELNVEYAELNGTHHDKVPTSDRWVYFVQYASGSEAWNCVTTNTIIFYSQSYSYRVMTQASGRIDRVNTKYKDLYYYHLSSKSRIDNEISFALDKKKKFNESTSSFGKEFKEGQKNNVEDIKELSRIRN